MNNSPAQMSDEQRALEIDCPVCAQKAGDWCLYQDFDTDSPAVSPTPHAARIARSRLEPVEAPKKYKGDDLCEQELHYFMEDRCTACGTSEPVEAVSTQPKDEFRKTWPPANMCSVVYPHDMGEKLICQRGINHTGAHWAKGEHCEYSWPKLSTPLPQQEEPAREETCRYCGNMESACVCTEGFEPTSIRAGEWIQPISKGYRMICCDCGLAHLMDFRIHKGKIKLRAFRESEPNPTPLLGQDEPATLTADKPWDMPTSDRKTYELVASVCPEERSPVMQLFKKYADHTFELVQTRDNLIAQLTQAITSLAAAQIRYEKAEKTIAGYNTGGFSDADAVLDKYLDTVEKLNLAEASLAEAQKRIEALEKELGR
jgi:hypothetical protein